MEKFLTAIVGGIVVICLLAFAAKAYDTVSSSISRQGSTSRENSEE